MALRPLNLYLFVTDIDAALQFYSRLGLRVERVSHMFGRANLGDDVILELGTEALTSSYDPAYVTPAQTSKGTINFELDSAQSVDEKFIELVSYGYQGYLPPIDALWQARFAIVLDPDGNQVGLHSPRDLHAERQREGSSK